MVGPGAGHEQPPLAPAEGETIRKRIWQRLRRGAMGSRLLPAWPRWAKLGAAASVGIVLAGMLYAYKGASLFGPLHLERTPPPGVIRVHNTSGKPQRVTLKDGSTVVLAPRSSISYPEHFGDKTRTIFLQGEARFDVRKDPNKPFIVQAGELMTQVLGTRFTVKSCRHPFIDCVAGSFLAARGPVCGNGPVAAVPG